MANEHDKELEQTKRISPFQQEDLYDGDEDDGSASRRRSRNAYEYDSYSDEYDDAYADEYDEDEVASNTCEEAPVSLIEDEKPEVEQVPAVEVKEPEKPLIEHINGLDVDTNTGEIIEPEQAPDPYADTELMYKIYLLLDQKVEIVK